MGVAARKPQAAPSSTRTAILEVATRLFARNGYDRVTMRDISAGAGFTLPTIYHHFKDKENLYREVELASYGALHQRLLSALQGSGSAKTRLRTFIGEMYDIFSEDAVFRSLAMRNMMDSDPRHHRFLVSATLQDVHEELERLLTQLGVGNNRTTPLALISGIFGFVAMEPAKRQLKGYNYATPNDPEERERFVDYLVGAALAS